MSFYSPKLKFQLLCPQKWTLFQKKESFCLIHKRRNSGIRESATGQLPPNPKTISTQATRTLPDRTTRFSTINMSCKFSLRIVVGNHYATLLLLQHSGAKMSCNIAVVAMLLTNQKLR